ncbi:uncharacterized protein LAJ45_07114 [Morchella importuna]|uniref:uncharacterized protein n=1 Tax=Morchella importuna TaxID=1174673 RepID=UPI001E8DD742|nr:uncharacterized protein LAJ45_07114 [Morchella importuna]KAH8148771.1 hypothetical protein LAJ45_07114 [Morchella importuna]
MGVPALFRWLTNKYPKIVSSVIEDQPQEVDGQIIPVDTTKPNPNGEEFDNLYLDMNGIVHPCSHPEDKAPPETEEEMMLEVFKYTERVVNMVRPRKLLMIAVDGVAPRAKMNQQRSRRFRSAKEAKEKEADTAEFIRMLEEKRGSKVDDSLKDKKVWDSNAITPGTPFMDILAASIKYWIAYKLNTDPAWAKMKVIISDSTVPGEGEHKIMEFVRSQRASPDHDPNTRHVIYGLDADLIMLGLGTHEPHFRVLREDVFAQEARAKTCKICGQKGHRAEECTGKAKEKQGEFDEKSHAPSVKPFVWLHVGILREYLEVELQVPGQGFKFDLERAIDDWVFMCFFVGNDFLPHLPSLEIRENGIDTLMAVWRDNLPVMGGYVTKDGSVELKNVQFILDGLAKQEDAIFRNRRKVDERREEGAKRRRLNESGGGRGGRGGRGGFGGNDSPADSPQGAGRGRGRGRGQPDSAPPPMIPLFKPGDITKDTRKMNYDMVMNRENIRKANLENKSAAQALKAQLMGGGSAEAPVEAPVNAAEVEEEMPDESSTAVASPVAHKRKVDEVAPSTPPTPADGEMPPDTVRLWENGYQDRYYEQKFGVSPDDYAFRKKVADAYVEGLCWVLLYYFQGCPSWNWYYPYHYAPFAQDFKDLGSLDIKFERGTPFKPFEQLMGVLPAASKVNLPEPFQKLMTDEDSEIIDFYPENFPIDLNGKKFAWQGVALLPFIDEKRLLDAAQRIYPLLSKEDAGRNAMGHDVLFVADTNELYDDVAAKFYSKRQDVTKYTINPHKSQGLSGTVGKDPAYIPRSTLPYPLKTGEMPEITDDRSMSLFFEFPKSKHVHKSQLLRGVKFNEPVLTRAEQEEVKRRSTNGGRSYGGAQLYRNNSGRGRGRGGGGGGGGDYGNNHQGSFRSDRGGGGGPPSYGAGTWSAPPPPPPPPGTWGGNNSWAPPGAPPMAGGPPPMSWRNNPLGGPGGYAPPPPPPGTGFSYGRGGGYSGGNNSGGGYGQQSRGDDRYRPGGNDRRGGGGGNYGDRDGGNAGVWRGSGGNRGGYQGGGSGRGYQQGYQR